MAAVKHPTPDTYKTRRDQQLKVEQGLVKNNRVCFPGLPQLYQTQITWQRRIPWETQPSAQDSCPDVHDQTGSSTELMTHRSISNHKHQTQTVKGDAEFSTLAWQKTSNRDLKYSNTVWFKKMGSILYVCISWTIHGTWIIYITFERGGPKFSNTTARALA